MFGVCGDCFRPNLDLRVGGRGRYEKIDGNANRLAAQDPRTSWG